MNMRDKRETPNSNRSTYVGIIIHRRKMKEGEFKIQIRTWYEFPVRSSVRLSVSNLALSVHISSLAVGLSVRHSLTSSSLPPQKYPAVSSFCLNRSRHTPPTSADHDGRRIIVVCMLEGFCGNIIIIIIITASSSSSSLFFQPCSLRFASLGQRGG